MRKQEVSQSLLANQSQSQPTEQAHQDGEGEGEMSEVDKYGFSNDATDLEKVRQWVRDAVADGWQINPTYQNEAVESAATLDKNGFRALVLMRDRGGDDKSRRYRYEAKVSAWGPDGLAINVPLTYDFGLIQKAVRKCGECGTEGVDAQRVGFAGRVCSHCLPAAQKKHEYPGWTN